MKTIETFEDGKLVTTERLPAAPAEAPSDLVARRMASDPLVAALVRRQAKVEGKTEAEVVQELAEEMK